jgi:hypothetical protein
VPEATPSEVPDAAPSEPPRREAPPGCFAVDLDAWAQALEAASDLDQAASKLAELGLELEVPAQPEPDLRVLEIRMEAVELDGVAPQERFFALALGESERDLEQVIAVVFTGAEPDFWCPVGASDLTVAKWDDFLIGPTEFELVDWLGDSRRAILRRSEVNSSSGDPASTFTRLSLFELRERELVEIFGPFTLFEAMESSYISDPQITGTVEPRGDFPRELHTTIETDCTAFRAACRDNPDVCREMELSCKPGRKSQVWRYTDGKYRR